MSESQKRGRLLVVAARPFQLEDLGSIVASTYDMDLVRRAEDVDRLVEEFRPDVALVDSSLREGEAFSVMEALETSPQDVSIVALTADPPSHEHVALAARAGAAGFVDINSSEEEFADALDAVRRGENWFPSSDMRGLLAAVADDLDTTTAERRSRLTGIVLALIPLTGLIAALQTGLWRRYLGSIGIRPIDLAVDPASRVIDAVVALLLVIGIVGPLLLVKNWLNMLSESRFNRGPVTWLDRHRVLAQIVLSLLWLGFAALMAIGPDIGLVVFVGPVVTLAIIAKALDVDDELPRFLRIEGLSTRVAVGGGIVTLVVFFGILAYETLIEGPDLRVDGVHGLIAPRVLGISAQPVEAIAVDSGESRELLYMGGNADLYVLIDPCKGNEVEMVSVGAHRLVVINDISCP